MASSFQLDVVLPDKSNVLAEPAHPSVSVERHSSSSGSVGVETTLGAVGFANAWVSVELTAEH